MKNRKMYLDKEGRLKVTPFLAMTCTFDAGAGAGEAAAVPDHRHGAVDSI